MKFSFRVSYITRDNIDIREKKGESWKEVECENVRM